MQNRHLNHTQLTLAAIDDIIARGKRRDWAELGDAMLADEAIRQRILRVCAVKVPAPCEQRCHFWKHYADPNAPA